MAAIDLSQADIVYPVLADGKNEELRYSLRSLKNLPHRRVVVISSGIDWLSDEVKQIVVDIDSQSYISKFEKVNKKLLWAFENDSVSDPFVLMNDDFFVMEPVLKLPYYCLGDLEDRLNRYNRRGSYAKDLIEARNALARSGDTTLDFEPHVPIVFYKDKLCSILGRNAWNGLTSGHRRSLYCNIMGVTPTYLKQDVKVYADSATFNKKSKFLSTENASFMNGEVGRFIRSRFPDKCDYEK